jgi:excisionase family DNA binding protein
MDERITVKVDDVARMLDVSRRTIQTWAKEGKIPHVRIDKVLRFVPEQIREWAKTMGQQSCNQSAE